MSQPKLNLTELVTIIRDELEKVDRARRKANRDAMFRLSGMELELSFVIEESSAAKGGFDIKVLALGAETGARTEQVQKVLLKYDVPMDFTTSRTNIGNFAQNRPSTKDSMLEPTKPKVL